MSYYVARSGQQYGPYTEEVVRSYLGAGSLSASDNIREESSPAWTTIEQLFQVPAVTPAMTQLSVEGNPPISLQRHEYRLSRWGQAIYLAFGVLAGYGIYTLSGETGGAAPAAGGNLISFLSMVQPAIAPALFLIGCYGVAFALRSRVVLDGTRISLRYAIREKSADLSELEGYRIDRVTWGGPYWRLELKEARGHILIMMMFHVDDYFPAFLSQLKNLDEK